jgi:hypothetical protein
MQCVGDEYIVLAGGSEWRRQFGRPEYRWEDNIRMVLEEIMWEGVD